MALPEHAPHIPHIPIPDVKGGLKWALKHWPVVGGATLTLAGGAGLAYQMFTGTDRGSQTAPVEPSGASDTIKPTQPEQPGLVVNPTLTDTPEPTATAEAQKTPTPEATKTPEKPQVCEFIPAQYCNNVELVEFINPVGWRVVMAGVNLDNKTPIFSVIHGSFRIALNDSHYAFIGDLSDPTLTTYVIQGDLEHINNLATFKVAPGDLVVRKGNSGYKSKIGDREYDITIGVSVIDPVTRQFSSPTEKIEKYFPGAKRVKTTVDQNPQPSPPKQTIGVQ